MTNPIFGELIPLSGGDTIPLIKKSLLIGRRESCDIVLRFSNVSAHHCQLTVNGGYWFVRDLDSRNGTKVNGTRITERQMKPGDRLKIAKHEYELKYAPIELGAVGPPMPEEPLDDVMNKSLLERAGLVNKRRAASRRYEVLDDSAGQLEARKKLDK